MIPIKCQNCSWKWDYSGQQKIQTTCPKCGYKVNINKNKLSGKLPNPQEKNKGGELT